MVVFWNLMPQLYRPFRTAQTLNDTFHYCSGGSKYVVYVDDQLADLFWTV